VINECTRESDVMEAVSRGMWPEDPRARDLVAHAEACPVCRDVAAVAVAMRREYDTAQREPELPSAGLIWWRLQLRARYEGIVAADTPIAIVQIVAGLVAAVLVLGLCGLVWPSLRESIAWIDQLSHAIDVGQFWLPAALAVGASLIVAPVVLLLVMSDD